MEGSPAIVVPAFGRTQLMLLHHCPARTLLGMTKGHKDCIMCDTGDERSLQDMSFTDRRGADFPLQRQRLP